jgi:hypothetical protein
MSPSSNQQNRFSELAGDIPLILQKDASLTWSSQELGLYMTSPKPLMLFRTWKPASRDLGVSQANTIKEEIKGAKRSGVTKVTAD